MRIFEKLAGLARAWAFFFVAASSVAQTSNTCPSSLSTDFYSKFDVVQAVLYVQTNSSGPALQGTNPYGFAAAITLRTNLSATAATVSLPGKPPAKMRDLANQQFLFGGFTNSFTNVLAAFPDGTYQFTISNSSWSVTLPQGIALPNTPTLLNYQAAQSIDSTKDFPLMWQGFAGGSSGDLISVDVRDPFGNSVLRTPKYGCSGDLDGTATSLLIPANALTNNQTYRVTILFAKEGEFDTNSFPNVLLVAGTEAQNLITISTSPGGTAPQAGIGITNVMLLGGQNIRFDLLTTPGMNYTVQFNADLQQPSGWTNLLTGTATSTLTPVTNNPAASLLTGFYRAFQN
jgi:hypothetical protein